MDETKRFEITRAHWFRQDPNEICVLTASLPWMLVDRFMSSPRPEGMDKNDELAEAILSYLEAKADREAERERPTGSRIVEPWQQLWPGERSASDED